MNNRELAELILVGLHSFAQKEGYGHPQSLLEIAKKFGEKDARKVQGILSELEARGLAEDCRVGGGVFGFITNQGAMMVEDGGETGIIPRFQTAPGTYIDQSTRIYGEIKSSQINAHSEIGSQAISVPPSASALADQIVKILRSESVYREGVADPLADAEQLLAEMRRPTPRMPIIKSLLSTLGDVSSVASLAMSLAKLLGV